jgi:ABC-type transport system involved in multi-copper enzyme maturation permease subunit
MSNLIRSDIFRLRGGATLRFTLIGLCAFLLFMALIMLMLSTGVFTNILERSSEFEAIYSSEAGKSQVDSLYTAMREAPESGSDFVKTFISAGLLSFFILPLIIAVFGADFAAGTYRNTLTFETRREKVYWAKLLTSGLCFTLLLAVGLVFSWLIGSLLFGFDGNVLSFVGWLLPTIVLQAPIYIGMICFIHFLLAFSQKNSAAIAVFLLVLVLFPSVIQLFTFLLPTFGWLAHFDLFNGLSVMADYAAAEPAAVILPIAFSLAVAVISTALGLYRYKKTDFA